MTDTNFDNKIIWNLFYKVKSKKEKVKWKK
jgi:hypothetical protein